MFSISSLPAVGYAATRVVVSSYDTQSLIEMNDAVSDGVPVDASASIAKGTRKRIGNAVKGAMNVARGVKNVVKNGAKHLAAKALLPKHKPDKHANPYPGAGSPPHYPGSRHSSRPPSYSSGSGGNYHGGSGLVY